MALSRAETKRLEELRDERWTEADARFVLRAQHGSGQSVLEFAREHGLIPQRLWRWRSRLGDVSTVTEEVEPLSFAPVVVTGLGRSAVVVVRVGDIEVEVIDPSKVEPRWIVELAEAATAAERRGR